jgi:hypothetical protein
VLGNARRSTLGEYAHRRTILRVVYKDAEDLSEAELRFCLKLSNYIYIKPEVNSVSAKSSGDLPYDMQGLMQHSLWRNTITLDLHSYLFIFLSL